MNYRVDLLVNDEPLIERKSVKEIEGIHGAQLLTYLKLTNVRKGIAEKFNVKKLKDGIKCFVFLSVFFVIFLFFVVNELLSKWEKYVSLRRPRFINSVPCGESRMFTVLSTLTREPKLLTHPLW